MHMKYFLKQKIVSTFQKLKTQGLPFLVPDFSFVFKSQQLLSPLTGGEGTLPVTPDSGPLMNASHSPPPVAGRIIMIRRLITQIDFV